MAKQVWSEGWLEPLVAQGAIGIPEHPTVAAEVALLLVSAVVSLAGIGVAYWIYVREPGLSARIQERLGFLYTLADKGFYFDQVYNAIVQQGIWPASRFLYESFDMGVIDGAVNGVARGVGWLGGQTRRLQNGLVGTYALTFLVGVVLVIGYFIVVRLFG